MTSTCQDHDPDKATRAPPDSDGPPVRDRSIGYVPILDVAKGSAAGYQAVPMPASRRGRAGAGPGHRLASAVQIVTTALDACSTLPTNTFISIPVPLDLLAEPPVLDALRDHGDLAGIVLDVTDFVPDLTGPIDSAVDELRSRGARISVGGRDTAQPELGSIVRLRPSFVRLGRDWVSDLDNSPAKRSAIEVTGRLAGQLDAWILVESVRTAGELRALSELGVPLAQGPFIGEAHTSWPDVEMVARVALPPTTSPTEGVLRSLVRQAYTTHDAAAARSVLPDASGFDSVVVIDDARRPVSLLERGTYGRWDTAEIMTVNVDTPVAEAVTRAMGRPRDARFLPLVCTDAAGRFVGILRIEQLMSHLVGDQTP